MPILRSRLRWVLVMLIACAIAAAVFAIQPRPFNIDASGFTVFGRGMLEGHAPYADLFDHKPPGIYVMGAIAWALDPGDSSVSFQLLTAIMIGISATACGWLVAEATGRFRVGAAAALVAVGGLSLPVLSAGGGMTETFATAGLAVCFATAVGMTKGRGGYIWPLLAGASFAWAMNMSLLAVAAVPALAAVWSSIPIDGGAYPLARSSWRTWLRRRLLDRRLLVAIAGSAGVTLVFWLPVLASGSLAAALDAVLRYNSLYQSAGTFRLSDWIHGFAQLWPFIPAAAILLVPVGRRSILGFELARSKLALAIALWLLAELAMLLYGRRIYIHYLTLLIAPSAIVFGLALANLWQDGRRAGFRIVGAVLLAATVAALAWHTRPTPSKASLITPNQQLAAYVRANSGPHDSIYAWGADTDLYVRSDRDPAGPYFFFLPLSEPGYGPEATAKTLAVWQAKPPRLVITATSTVGQRNSLQPLDAVDGSASGAATVDTLEPLRAFIKNHYDLVATLPGGQVWRYRG